MVSFKVFHPDKRVWVDVNLKRGQFASISGGGELDDGFAYWDETFIYDEEDNVIRRVQTDWGNDGEPYEVVTCCVCQLDKLNAVPEMVEGHELYRPDWELEACSDQDNSLAEAS